MAVGDLAFYYTLYLWFLQSNGHYKTRQALSKLLIKPHTHTTTTTTTTYLHTNMQYMQAWMYVTVLNTELLYDSSAPNSQYKHEKSKLSW